MPQDKRFAIVVRGPSGAGKTALCGELARILSTKMGVKSITLDKHSGVSSNHRPRSYHNLDSLTDDCVLIELGDGGDATRNPEKWADKLTSQGYSIHLFLLDAPLDELRKRTATRTDWKDIHTIASWNSYRYDPNFGGLPKRLDLTELVVDTTKTSTSEAAKVIIESLDA